MDHNEILHMVEGYYSEKIKTFGPVPRGVDWSSNESQELRFDQLVKILPESKLDSSLLDFGCGYGALLTYFQNKKNLFNYTGYDISTEMINTAKRFHTSPNVAWISNTSELSIYDYLIASGIFNVKEQTPDQEWEYYMYTTLDDLNKLCRKGFAFNILSDYSDVEKRKDNLYYASPKNIFHYCKSNFSKYVTLLHDYPLYEFTILVRKDIS